MKKYYNLLLIVVFVFLEVFFLVNPKVIISSFNTNTNMVRSNKMIEMYGRTFIIKVLLFSELKYLVYIILIKNINNNYTY